MADDIVIEIKRTVKLAAAKCVIEESGRHGEELTGLWVSGLTVRVPGTFCRG
jgi:hypothetical protein